MPEPTTPPIRFLDNGRLLLYSERSGWQNLYRIDLADGTNAKPVCKANDGTTGETNNLNLGACKAKPGKGVNLPYVQFVESLAKK